MLTEPNRPTQPTVPSGSPNTLLHQLARQLTTLGLDIREHHRGGQLTEIAITNPRDPGTGRAVIGCDGYLTWERWCTLRTNHDLHPIAHAIGVLLEDTTSQQPPSAHCKPTTQLGSECAHPVGGV